MLIQHKLRAFLTMLGVIIGVMSVTLIVMISNGFQSYINDQFSKLGANTIFLFFDPGRRESGQTTGGKDSLTFDDITYLKKRVTSIDLLSAVVTPPTVEAHYLDKSMSNPRMQAVDANYETLNALSLVEGRTFTAADVDNYANICIIGKETQTRLFGTAEPLGKFILVGGLAMKVVGVLKSETVMGDSTDRILMVPISTAQKKWVGGSKIDFILLRAKPGVGTTVAMEDIWEAMMAKSGNRPIYRVDSSQSIIGVFTGIVGVAGSILAAIAALSLLVGGIGIMNIMLVSVTERTREIGLRKAVGARRGAILLQFLIEAGVLSLVGGLIGMFLAWSLGQTVGLVTAAKHWPKDGGLSTPFPVTAAILAAVFSAAIGMVFGFYPAMTASKLDPIVALRTE